MTGETIKFQADQFIRLKRETPRTKQAQQSGMLGGVILLVGGIILYIAYSSMDKEPFSESWVTFLVGGGFSLFGLLLAFATVKQSFANLLPETIVGIDHLPVQAGDTVRIGICQPGPVRIKSISAIWSVRLLNARRFATRRPEENTGNMYQAFPASRTFFAPDLLMSPPAARSIMLQNSRSRQIVLRHQDGMIGRSSGVLKYGGRSKEG